MVTISLKDGQLIGNYVKRLPIYRIYGVTPDLIWIGSFTNWTRKIFFDDPSGVFGISLPYLKIKIDLDKVVKQYPEIRNSIESVAADSMAGILCITTSNKNFYDLDPNTKQIIELNSPPPELQPTLSQMENKYIPAFPPWLNLNNFLFPKKPPIAVTKGLSDYPDYDIVWNMLYEGNYYIIVKIEATGELVVLAIDPELSKLIWQQTLS